MLSQVVGLADEEEEAGKLQDTKAIHISHKCKLALYIIERLRTFSRKFSKL